MDLGEGEAFAGLGREGRQKMRNEQSLKRGGGGGGEQGRGGERGGRGGGGRSRRGGRRKGWKRSVH